MSTFSAEELEEFQTVFQMFDQDSSGAIDEDEIRQVMIQLGEAPSDDELKAMIREVDHRGRGEIDYDGFLTMMAKQKAQHEAEVEQEVNEAFKEYDQDGKGFISINDLKNLLKGQKTEKISAIELEGIISEADHKKNGQILFSHFVKMMLTK